MTKTQTDGGPAPCSPPGTMTDHERAKELVAARFRIGDELHDAPPKRWTDGECNQVAAYVRDIEAERDRLREALRMPVELHDNNPTAAKWELWDSWVLHPAGLRAARAALNGGGGGDE